MGQWLEKAGISRKSSSALIRPSMSSWTVVASWRAARESSSFSTLWGCSFVTLRTSLFHYFHHFLHVVVQVEERLLMIICQPDTNVSCDWKTTNCITTLRWCFSFQNDTVRFTKKPNSIFRPSVRHDDESKNKENCKSSKKGKVWKEAEQLWGVG